MKFLLKVMLFSACLFSSLAGYTQVVEKSNKIEFIGGKNYYLHTVKSGQTLYSIANAYGTTVSDIQAVNPGMKTELSVDQVIKILVKNTEPVINSSIHIVKQGETLSGIAQHYKVTLVDIFKLNPGITSEIKPGQEIKIPKAPSVSVPATTASKVHVVEKGETLFSIARKYSTTVDDLRKMNPGLNESLQIGQQIRVPVKEGVVEAPVTVQDTVRFECMKTGLLPSYNVGLLMPLYLDKLTNIDTTDEEKSVKNYSSFAFIGFYEGFMIALDSLQQNGLNIKLMVDDITEDTNKLESVLKKPAYSDLNLLIGPFFSNVFTKAAVWAKEKNVKIVNPFTSRSEFVADNPQVFKNMPSPVQQAKQTIDYIRTTWPGCNIILAQSNVENDKEMIDAFANALKGNDSSASDYFMVKYPTEGFAGISKHMKEGKVNIVISFVHGEASTSNYIRNMSDLSFRYPLVVFGPSDWEQYSTLESEYLLNIHLHVLSASFVDYETQEVKDFLVKYRTRYHSEPDEYAFCGYDVALYYLEALRLYGKDFQNCLNDYQPKLLQSYVKFEHINNGGWENTRFCIIRYQDYKRINAFVNPQLQIEVNQK